MKYAIKTNTGDYRGFIRLIPMGNNLKKYNLPMIFCKKLEKTFLVMSDIAEGANYIERFVK